MPLVSVIVPSYNKPEYLPECLKSIQAQTFTDWECIVVDDGSPCSEEILSILALLNDSRFRVVRHKQNRGAAAARNTGVHHSKGFFLIHVDDDDLLVPEAIEKLLNEQQKFDADIVAPARIKRGCGGEVEIPSVPTLEIALAERTLPCVGFLCRKSLWQLIGGQDEFLIGCEDFEWMLRAVAAGVKIVVTTDILYVIRMPVTELDARKSNAARGRRYADVIGRYIVDKHRQLYDRYPDARAKLLFKLTTSQAREFLRSGARPRAFMAAMRAVKIAGTLDSVRWFLSFVADCVLGEDRRPIRTRFRSILERL
jgi:hypothetical protein